MITFDSQNDILFRKGHPRRAIMTIFWVFCPMLVKLFLDIANRMKKYGFSFGFCGCGACKVSFWFFSSVQIISQSDISDDDHSAKEKLNLKRCI